MYLWTFQATNATCALSCNCYCYTHGLQNYQIEVFWLLQKLQVLHLRRITAKKCLSKKDKPKLLATPTYINIFEFSRN